MVVWALGGGRGDRCVSTREKERKKEKERERKGWQVHKVAFKTRRQREKEKKFNTNMVRLAIGLPQKHIYVANLNPHIRTIFLTFHIKYNLCTSNTPYEF
jgi:hypothetical protein